MNKFVLKLEGNGYAFPCNICSHVKDDAVKCRKCPGYEKVNSMAQFDIEIAIEAAILKELETL